MVIRQLMEDSLLLILNHSSQQQTKMKLNLYNQLVILLKISIRRSNLISFWHNIWVLKKTRESNWTILKLIKWLTTSLHQREAQRQVQVVLKFRTCNLVRIRWLQSHKMMVWLILKYLLCKSYWDVITYLIMVCIIRTGTLLWRRQSLSPKMTHLQEQSLALCYHPTLV